MHLEAGGTMPDFAAAALLDPTELTASKAALEVAKQAVILLEKKVEELTHQQQQAQSSQRNRGVQSAPFAPTSVLARDKTQREYAGLIAESGIEMERIPLMQQKQVLKL